MVNGPMKSDSRENALAADRKSRYLSASLSDNPNSPLFDDGNGYPLSRIASVLLVGWSLFLTAGFALAISLDPDPRGYGTHQKMGLPPCTFRVMFDLPCPSCGMTTSFAHFVRGQFLRSAQANVAGLLLAAVCAVQVPWCWYSIYRGRLWNVSRPDVGLVWLLCLVCGVCLLQWAGRILFH